MKSIKIMVLTPLLLLYFPFIALSENRRGSLPPPVSCDIYIPYTTVFSNITSDDFTTPHAGTLANEDYSEVILLSFENCSKNNTEITVSIDNKSIDFNNGYFINHATGPTASNNITFQLIDDENNPINLNQKNKFTKTIDEHNEVHFHFLLNYVKKDDLPPMPGSITTHIMFNMEANDQIIESDKIIDIGYQED
ncbi:MULTISPECIES: fimbrial protein [Proteus]|uniref:fimbrial protein n=1 Tax=Proteus TaxID=583 RepID=UPI001377F4CD|nr:MULTISPECIES: fimbrial protein [Proteus]MCO8052165.1 fimbrial protein [Proteus penneri]MCX2589430.1 fimbrial protein [Proteus penneri]NBL76154.1 fimbrial protein [Proteus sp. G2672]NBL89282.1 fimbrial protein [Proteus sp. G2673]NBM02745.1 fimbrial protein [Proteus sp. G2671]